MNCTVFRERVFELIEGLLPPPEEAAARAHLAACAECPAHLASAREFGQLLTRAGDQAIEDWAAHSATRRVLAVAAKDARPAARRDEPSAGMWMRVFPYGVAAAALIAAGVIVHKAGPEELSEGRPTVLARGEHMLAAAGREVEGEDRADVLVPPGSRGEIVRLTAGSALFRVEPGNAFAVETPQGTASVLGTSFHVAVARDRSVSVSVHSGRVKFAGTGGTRTIEPGERLDVDARGAQRVVARTRLDELETALAAADARIRSLEEAARSQRSESAAPAKEAVPPVPEDDSANTLPWDQLGAAMRELLTRSPGFDDRQSPKYLKSLGLIFEHADELRKLTDAGDPKDALWHPASLQRLAEPFCAALAPDAPAGERAAASAAIREAARQSLLRLGGRPVPMEVAAERAMLRRAMLIAARDHLGKAAAAELAGFIRRDGLKFRAWAVWQMKLDDATAAGIDNWWVKELALTEDQVPALHAATVAYIEATMRAQDAIIARIGSDAATKILFPRVPGSGKPQRPGASGGPDSGSSEVDLDEVLRVLDIKLELAQPRIEFERAVAAVPRPDQPQITPDTMSVLATFQRSSK